MLGWYLHYIVQRGAGASQKAAEGRILASKIKSLCAMVPIAIYVSLTLVESIEVGLMTETPGNIDLMGQ